ncbi:hypothetical protein [Aureimonas sp. AU22]|uniref:hypothetical protein n=1 Tax=Aureimonas sp. AU22 TaxID=1638162 RepID=UPI0012E344B0|nr:hypothetical protein [Aureimonas sp. AU22]
MRAFGRTEGYPVILRGLENGAALFATDCAFVISNTGHRGCEVAAKDRRAALLSDRRDPFRPSSPRSSQARRLVRAASMSSN